MQLNNILHVPDSTKNLLSISQFLKDNSVVIEFFSTHCVVKDLTTQRILLKGVLKNGLYQLNLDHLAHMNVVLRSKVFNCNKIVGSQPNKYMLWYYRLGHPCSSTV